MRACEGGDVPAAGHPRVMGPLSHHELAWPPSLTECCMQTASTALEAQPKLFRAASLIN